MQKYFSYIRVSTAKQGEHGVSLHEQQEAIERYSQRQNLQIVQRFEERETAAKRGRPIFTQMLRLLRQGKADGVIIHKIDRSARNLKDWSDLGELIDQGIQVHFANESLDLHSRGGRLSADIQAVIAADYIRNLREETRKGFYGRLKQGVYPLPAPIGYIDKGAGKPKEPDPLKGPLVRKAFELYATAGHDFESLGNELYRLGLRNRRGARITRNGLSTLLNNPFYIGLIRLRRSGETFPGGHLPLIPKSLFDRVQAVLRGNVNPRSIKHEFVFSRLLTCEHCEYSLIGERQKGHVYYRCHTRYCRTTSIREEAVDATFRSFLARLRFDEEEFEYVRMWIERLRQDWVSESEHRRQTLELRLGVLNDRLARLTDAFLDGLLEKDLFEERKTAILEERRAIEDDRAELKSGPQTIDRIAEILELAGNVNLQYESAIPLEKREIVRSLTSNRLVDGRNVELALRFPFDLLASRAKNTNGAPYRDGPRTFEEILLRILQGTVPTEAVAKRPAVWLEA